MIWTNVKELLLLYVVFLHFSHSESNKYLPVIILTAYYSRDETISKSKITDFSDQVIGCCEIQKSIHVSHQYL